MKYALVGAVALVIGLVLGTIPYRSQVGGLQAELQQAREAECKPRVGSELAGMFAGRPPMSGGGAPAPEPLDPIEPREEGDDEPAAVDEPAPDWPENLEENLDIAKEALELRRTQAREAMMQRADPDDAQIGEIDTAIDDMNRDLRALAEDLVAQTDSGEELTRRDMMGFAAEALDIFIVAEDRIADTLDADQMAALDDASVDPFSYVDPELLDLFAQLDREDFQQ